MSASMPWITRTFVRGRTPGRASATLQLASLVLPRLTRVGYVRGAADRVPEALTDVGIPITLLGPQMLERGNLDRFDAIVIGPRAYETDSALVENNRRLLNYARRGGLVIVQYQQQRFFNGGFAPFPMKVGGPPLPPPGSARQDIGILRVRPCRWATTG